MKRKIIHINEEKCNGCGLCAQACHEAAIEIIDGKAKLVSDEYCDGLGNCLPECPTGAIEMIEKETIAYDDEAVQQRKAKMQEESNMAQQTQKQAPMACGCPGTMAKLLNREAAAPVKDDKKEHGCCSSANGGHGGHGGQDDYAPASELRQWPVQLNLVGTGASYLDNADLLIAADCTAYAYANFHRDFIKGRITLIGCPKLDDNQYYTQKLTEMFRQHPIRSITVVRMQVPCCGGIVSAVKTAMLKSETIVPYSEVIITPDGRIL